jgi:uncharacterized membrane protein YphA (DoxX/SURF4 family)
MQPEMRMESEPQLAAQVQVQETEPCALQDAKWRLTTRIAFRFVFAYFVLYNFPFPLDYIPYVDRLVGWYGEAWEKVIPWIGAHLLHLSYKITVLSNGSGDTTFDYVQVLCYLVIATVATVIWSLLDRRRTNYDTMQQWLRLYVRLALASAMISYGAAKVLPGQFSAPPLSTLLDSYGDSSPMHLLWTFMGASRSYTAFAGFAEMLGGALLFVPRFTTLGALMLIGVMSNVFMLNMSYDVPVKQYSFHLLLMAVFLAAPDLRRLADLFLLKRKVQLRADQPLFRRKRLNRGILALQLVFGLFLIVTSLRQVHQEVKEFGATIGPPLEGVWSVDEYSVDGVIRPPLLTDNMRWRRFVFHHTNHLMMETMDGHRRYFLLGLDKAKQTITLRTRNSATGKAELLYENPQPDLITLRGDFEGHSIQAKSHRMPKFLLTSRGFHWINEYPFNTTQANAGGGGQAFGIATANFPLAAAAGKHIKYSGYIRTEAITEGFAGLWWRVDGESRQVLAFDNMEGRGPKGTTPWTRYEISLDVPASATNINFGVLHVGNGTAWFDSLRVEIDGKPYTDANTFDLDFESDSPRGFHTGGNGYDVTLDKSVAHTGKQSLRSQFVSTAQ